MRCINCGVEYEAERCPRCGLSEKYSRVLYRYEERQREKQSGNYRPRKKKKSVFGKWWFWLVAPIGAFVLLALFVAIFSNRSDNENLIPDNAAIASEAKKREKTEENEPQNRYEVIQGLTNILEKVGIDRGDADDIEQIEDWQLGPRFRFDTHGTSVYVYCNMDYTVRTLKVGNTANGPRLYEQGYEPWRIDNFLVDDSTRNNLINRTEEVVKSYLNYPSAADFPVLDWAVGREFSRYTVSSQVEAQNAFGVKEEVPFTAVFWVDGETTELIYLSIDGDVIVDDVEKHPLPERKETGGGVLDGISQNGEIRIIDEKLGEYGEVVELDSYKYFWYHVPAGAYTVVSNVKSCKVYVDKNEITRNADGFVEMENVATLEMVYGINQEVKIEEDEHIFLTIGADITLIPIE